MGVEHIHETQNVPSLDSLLQKTGSTLKEGKKFLVEGIPQVEACVERHQEHMAMFCESDKGFGKIVKRKKVISKIEK